VTGTKTKVSKPFVCLECGRRFTAKAAERAQSEGCPGCNGSDIDLYNAPAPLPPIPEATYAVVRLPNGHQLVTAVNEGPDGIADAFADALRSFGVVDDGEGEIRYALVIARGPVAAGGYKGPEWHDNVRACKHCGPGRVA
jgi:hypothetical protein